MALAAPGIGSSLDVNSIVSQLVSLERRPITVLDQREAGVQAKITAFGTIKGALSTFQSAARGLSDAGRFLAYKASSGDTAVATISASSVASAASYTLDVTTLAQAQKLTATGQASSSAAIGNGTLTFDFGTISGGAFDSETGKYTGAGFGSNGGGSKSVTIDSSNNSLQGIRDAINSADIGVTATIVNDGDAAAPYRLVLSSETKGVSNSVKISVSGDAALSNLLAHDPAGTQNLAQSIAAQNATFKVDGVAISKTSNTVTDVIEGVTFTLQKEAASTTLSVTRDTAAVQSSVQAFVKAYNDVNKILSDASAFNAATQQGAILQGDSAIRGIQNQIRSTLTGSLTGLSGNLTLLSQVGVSFQKDGSLALDALKLQGAIENNFSDIAGLFAAVGKGTDSLVAFTSSTANTRPGNYAVAISQLATQGKSVGAKDVSGGVTITGANSGLDVTIDGVAATITLDEGTYTASELATQLQSKINGANALSSAGAAVSVAVNGNALVITSSRYGAASSVTVSGGTAKTDIFGTGADTAGLDVAGSIGGVAATGAGQVLTGAGDADGLRVTISGHI
jgi:flagellar hook-associated protein 2